MQIPEWIISPSGVEMEKEKFDTFLKKLCIEIIFDLKYEVYVHI